MGKKHHEPIVPSLEMLGDPSPRGSGWETGEIQIALPREEIDKKLPTGTNNWFRRIAGYVLPSVDPVVEKHMEATVEKRGGRLSGEVSVRKSGRVSTRKIGGIFIDSAEGLPFHSGNIPLRPRESAEQKSKRKRKH